MSDSEEIIVDEMPEFEVEKDPIKRAEQLEKLMGKPKSGMNWRKNSKR